MSATATATATATAEVLVVHYTLEGDRNYARLTPEELGTLRAMNLPGLTVTKVETPRRRRVR